MGLGTLLLNCLPARKTGSVAIAHTPKVNEYIFSPKACFKKKLAGSFLVVAVSLTVLNISHERGTGTFAPEGNTWNNSETRSTEQVLMLKLHSVHVTLEILPKLFLLYTNSSAPKQEMLHFLLD